MKLIKNIFVSLIILLLISTRVAPYYVLAQEESSSPTPTAESEVLPTGSPLPSETPEASSTPSVSPSPTATANVEVENSGDVTNDITSESDTGQNVIQSPSPSAFPTSSPSSTPKPSAQPSQNNQNNNSSGDTDNSDEKPMSTPPPATPTPPPTTTVVDTGDAVSVTEVQNDINSTQIDSQVVFQTLNIFVDGDVNLSVNPLNIVDSVLHSEHGDDELINVSVYDGVNYAYIVNDIDSIANTGVNTVESNGNPSVATGDAYSIVSLLNKINTTIIGSTIHVVTINIFGEVNGNIILPDVVFPDTTGCCGGDLDVDNLAQVVNQVNSSANTGGNTLTVSDSGNIDTGYAESVVNTTNIVNSNYINANLIELYINVFGSWLGDFIGWGGVTSNTNGSVYSLTGDGLPGDSQTCSSCVGDAGIVNEAYVQNNINSQADTGHNLVSGQNGNIVTGDAYSAVSIFNFVNLTFRNVFGFIGFINIFGTLHGNIGGAAEFEKLAHVDDNIIEEATSNEPGDEVRGEGDLTVESSNNVNQFVYPGDTITFTVRLKNTGDDSVRDAKWGITLIDENGEDLGGAIFGLSDIQSGKTYRISTGLVLSKNALPGNYIARAFVLGKTGSDNKEIGAYSDSYFSIHSKGTLAAGNGNTETLNQEEVLGTTDFAASNNPFEKILFYVFLALWAIYLPLKGYQRRNELKIFFARTFSVVGEKALAFRSFFASFFA